MTYEIRVEQRRATPLAVVRRRARVEELAKVVPEACGLVWGVVRDQRQVIKPGRNVTVYWDGQINLEVGVEVAGQFSGCGEVVASAAPAGQVAGTTHYGPYNQLGAAHEAIRRWCEGHEYTRAGPCWEVYGHWQEEWNRDPAKIVTEVYYLLATG